MSALMPRLPDPPLTIAVGPLTFRLLHDFSRFSNGKMLMMMQDCLADFTDEGGVKGAVGAALGGTIFVQIDKRLWACSPELLVQAVREAEAEYLKAGAAPSAGGAP